MPDTDQQSTTVTRCDLTDTVYVESEGGPENEPPPSLTFVLDCQGSAGVNLEDPTGALDLSPAVLRELAEAMAWLAGRAGNVSGDQSGEPEPEHLSDDGLFGLCGVALVEEPTEPRSFCRGCVEVEERETRVHGIPRWRTWLARPLIQLAQRIER